MLPDSERQSVLPETSARLRRLGWIFFLPLGVLAGIGGYYLTEDRRLAFQRVQAESHEFLLTAGQQIGLSNALSPDFRLENGGEWSVGAGGEPEAIIYRDWDGNDLYPRAQSTNAVQLDAIQLAGQLSQLWATAEKVEFREAPVDGIAGYRDFLEADPPLEYEFEARYRKALLTLRSGDLRGALADIETLIKDCPSDHPVHQRSQWLRATANPAARDDDLEAACASWITMPTAESRAMLEMVGKKAVWKERPNVLERWQGIKRAGSQRLKREDRARALSPKIPNRLRSNRDWKVRVYLVDDAPEALFVMRRRASTKKGHLLVAWTQGQLGRRLAPLLSAEKLREVRRPTTVNMMTVKLDGRGIWGHAWPDRRQQGALKADRFADLKMVPIATNLVEGFEVVASAAPGAIARESNKRIAWFAMLMLFAGVISVMAWKFARRSLLHLDTLNQEKSNFVSSVSHELRTPVASMQLMAESLHEGKIGDAEKQKEYFAMILHECRRLGSLVHNVLDFARIEQRRKEYEFCNCNLAELIGHVANLMKPTADEREIPIFVDGTRVDAEVDAEAIQQALINLLDNAIKFSPKRSEVRISLAALDGGVVRIAVSDQGPGVPEDQRERIFERFYRREDELRRETKGVGIGLSIVKHVVEAHGGCVKVSTNEHQGAVFVIEIPERNPEKDDVTNSVS